jgi:hypothetical protein
MKMRCLAEVSSRKERWIGTEKDCLYMAKKSKKKIWFHVIGVVLVGFWLVMIGLLVRKVHFHGTPPETDHELEVSALNINSPQREWKEIYLKNRKVGYATGLIRAFDEEYFIQEEIFLKLNLMGFGSGVYTLTQSRLDHQFLLKSFRFNMTSGVVAFQLTGKVEDGYLMIESGKGKNRRSQRIKLSAPPMIGAGLAYYFKSRDIAVGETYRLPVFDPSTLAQKEVVIRVTDRESLDIYGIRYDAFRLEGEMWGQTITFWLDENGTTLKEEGFMGMTTIKSSAARAPQDIEGPEGEDLYEMTAIKIEKMLPDPDRLSSLRLRIAGIDSANLNPVVWEGKRQSYQDGVLEIRRERVPSKTSYVLPNNDYADEVKPFLEPEFNIESDDEEIIRQVGRIIGEDKNPISVSRKLLNWVYRSLEKRPVISIPSAVEVLRTRIGDCNEHATLLTAMLRAAGIPARINIGLVYTRQKFFYHAWTEAYLGEWISMDATLNQMPVDVTHVKFVEGNLDKQVEIAGLIGALTLDVLDYQYD